MPKKAAAKKAKVVADDDAVVVKFIADVEKLEEDNKSTTLQDNLKTVTLNNLSKLEGWALATAAQKKTLVSALLTILKLASKKEKDSDDEDEEEEDEEEAEDEPMKKEKDEKADNKGKEKAKEADKEDAGGGTKRKRRTAKPGCVLVSDCIKVHTAIHEYPKVKSVTLSTGETISIEITKSTDCRKATVANVSFMEQNKAKPSTFAKKAKQGHKITWVLYQRKWGMLCDGRVEIDCPLFDHDNPDEYLGEDEEEEDDEDEASAESSSTKKTTAKKTATKKTPPKKEEVSDTHLLSLSIAFPTHWENPNNKSPAKVPIGASSAEFKKLAAMFTKTAGKKVEITTITRLQHPTLWMRYFMKRQHVSEANDSSPEKISYVLTEQLNGESNEYYFYHGCNPTVVDKIIDGGFDERLGSLSGLFGSGIYFAENSAKSIGYTHTATCKQVGANYGKSVCTCSGSKDKRFVFISRAVLGTPWIRLVSTDRENPMRRPPERPNGTLYDSVMGECRAHDKQATLAVREYIVYDRHQTYPEYLIEFNLA